MQSIVTCPCGSRLKVDLPAGGIQVVCPQCKQMLKIGSQQQPTPLPGNMLIKCGCGQPMEVAMSHAGSIVACPACSQQLRVPHSGVQHVPVYQTPNVFDHLPAAPITNALVRPPAPPQRSRPTKPAKKKPKTDVAQVVVRLIGGLIALACFAWLIISFAMMDEQDITGSAR